MYWNIWKQDGSHPFSPGRNADGSHDTTGKRVGADTQIARLFQVNVILCLPSRALALRPPESRIRKMLRSGSPTGKFLPWQCCKASRGWHILILLIIEFWHLDHGILRDMEKILRKGRGRGLFRLVRSYISHALHSTSILEKRTISYAGTSVVHLKNLFHC
jgi:hypothetical protein